jgi:homoserine O-acetyltransferase
MSSAHDAAADGPAERAAPATYPGQKEAAFVVKDFRFQTGETLPEVRLHYVTLGTPRRDSAGRVENAVLLLHGTPHTAKLWFSPTMAPELFGPGQPLDAARYYVILPDGLGRGGSTKPSDGLHAKFPRYGYADVVNAQHLLVTKGLGVEHLRAIVGTSMGGMHAWMWAERYPDMMDAAMPIACEPIAISGRNLLFRRILTQAIRNDPDWQDGEYTSPPRHWLHTAPLWAMMLEILYWVESSWDYDPQRDLASIKARVAAVNFADDEINLAELPQVEELVRSIPGARFVLVPASEDTAGHRTLRLAAVWKPFLEELLRSTARAGAR